MVHPEPPPDDLAALALELSPDGVVVTHQDTWRVVWANPAFVASFLGADAPVGADLALVARWQEPALEGVRKALAETGRAEAELAAGDSVHSVRARVASRPEGAVVLWFVRDVTVEAHARGELEEAARNYRLLADNSRDVIVRTDRHGRRLYTSPSAFAHSGYTPDELAGTSPFDQFHPDDVPRLREEMRILLSVGEPRTTVYRSRRKDGTWLWHESISTPVRDPSSGEVVEVHTSTRDVTARVTAERALRESEERYRNIFEALAEGVLLVHRDGTIVSANPAAQRIFGTPVPMAGMRLPSSSMKVYDAAGTLLEKTPVLETLADARPRSGVELRFVREDGAVVWVETSTAVAALGEDGKPEVAVTSFVDLRAKKEAELARQRSEETLHAVEERYRLLFENLTTPFALHEMVLDDAGRPVDYRWLEVNPAYERLLGKTQGELIGKRVTEVLPGTEAHWIETFGGVARDGVPLQYENFSRELDRWFETWVFRPRRGQFAVLVSDTTERHRAAEQLRKSEERYRVIAENSLDMISRHDAAGKYLYASPAAFSVVGIEAEALLGSSPFERIHEDDHELVRQSLASVLTSPDPSRVRYRVRVPDGTIRTLESLSRSHQREDGSLEIQVSSRDVTEQEELQRQHRDLDAFSRAVFTTVGALVVVLDREGRVRLFNPTCEAVTGWREDEVLGRPFFDLFVPDDQREATRGVFRGLAAGQFPSRFENDWLTRDGERRWISWANTAILDEQGDVKFVVGTGLDRSEQRRADLARAKAEDDLREANASLERRVAERTAELRATNAEIESFSYSVSHDLRTPLRAINGFSRIILDDHGGELSEPARAHFDRIRAASARMGELVDDILLLSRSTRAEISRAVIDVSTMAAQIVDDLRRASPERVVSVTIAPGLTATADPQLARLVLSNLIGNAWKYSARKDDAHVTIGETVRGGARLLFVRDDGAGFDMRYADKLFGVFQRLHGAREFEGNGIGLATVHRILMRHGGRIEAEGEVGRGAEFRFTFEAGTG